MLDINKIKKHHAIGIGVCILLIVPVLLSGLSYFFHNRKPTGTQGEMVQDFLDSRPLQSNKDIPQALLISTKLLSKRLKEITQELKEIKEELKKNGYLEKIGK